MLKIEFACPLLLCLLWPWPLQGGQVQSAPEIEKEISTLDADTRQALARQMLGQLKQNENQPRSCDAEAQANASTLNLQVSAVSAAPVPRALPDTGREFSWSTEKLQNRGDFLPLEKTASQQFIPIPEQPDNPLLLTIGDLVYFPTPSFRTLHVEERYGIYKVVKYPAWVQKTTETLFGLEAVGRLKILEVNPSLTIARVITARDIIRKSDIIYVSDQP